MFPTVTFESPSDIGAAMTGLLLTYVAGCAGVISVSLEGKPDDDAVTYLVRAFAADRSLLTVQAWDEQTEQATGPLVELDSTTLTSIHVF
jgi:hypothetical protein